MRIDECALDELIVESEDLQSDALRDTKATIADDLGEERRGQKVDPGEIRSFNARRRELRTSLGTISQEHAANLHYVLGEYPVPGAFPNTNLAFSG